MSPSDDIRAVVPGALHAFLAELDRTVDWKLDCMREAQSASHSIAHLTRAVEAALWAVPAPDRAAYQRRLEASLNREAQGTGARVQFSDRVMLLHRFLAETQQSKTTSKEVLAYLRAHGLDANAKVVARLMAAKCDQGLLTRLSRGQYRIEREHKVLQFLRKAA